MKRPNFFIIGAAKAGTTALADYLREHPQVFMCIPKEPHYFSADFPELPGVHGREEYLNLFEDAAESHIAVGEASISYLYSSKAIPAIKEFDEDARIIVLLRNPIDMVHALHSTLLFMGQEKESAFEIAWQLSARRKQGKEIPRSNYTPEFLYYDEIARFGKQMRRVYAHFPKDQVHIVLFDDLVSRTRDVYLGTLKFLGLPDDGRDEFPQKNPSRRHRSNLLGHWTMQPTASVMGLVNGLKKILGIKEVGVLERVRSLNQVVEPRAPISAELVAEIKANYADDLQDLSQLLDLDLYERWFQA